MLHPALAAERQAVVASLSASAGKLRDLLPFVEQGADIEALHQFRVELRRIRTALKALRGALPVEDCATLIEDCRWLARCGSELRDADVFQHRLPEYLGDELAGEGAARHRIERGIAKLRSHGRRDVLRALRSRRAQRLVERLQEFIDVPPGRPGWSARPELARAVGKALRRLIAQGRGISAQTPPESVHELRKRCKRLRYLLEMIASAGLESEAEAALRRLRKLQTVLGDFQDFTTHTKMIEALCASSPELMREAATQAVVGRLLETLRARAAEARERAEKRFADFADGKPRRRLSRLLAARAGLQRPFVATGGYCHGFADGSRADLPVGKIVCVGRNYAAHAAELGNPVPERPLLFIKPPSAAVDFAPFLRVPTDAGSVHHEIEIAVLIGRELCAATPEQARAAIAGLGLAIDLTLRDLQDGLKAQGHPWEIAKGFDGACGLGPFVPLDPALDLGLLELRLSVNGRRRQAGSSAQMLMPIVELLCFASRQFSLWPGDVLLTGTPKGVGPMKPGDRLSAELVGLSRLRSEVTG